MNKMLILSLVVAMLSVSLASATVSASKNNECGRTLLAMEIPPFD